MVVVDGKYRESLKLKYTSRLVASEASHQNHYTTKYIHVQYFVAKSRLNAGDYMI